MQLELFTVVDELQEVAPGVDSSLNLESLSSFFLNVKQKVTDILSIAVWDKIKDDKVYSTLLKMAVGNLVMYNNLIFYNISKNGGNDKLFKYQYNELKDLYINNHHTAMNGLLETLDSGNVSEWKETQFYKDREALLIKSHKDFGRYYQIDGSAYFFSKIIYLLRETQRDEILPRIKDASVLAENVSLKEKVGSAMAYCTMAKALKRFDFSEFPASLRSYITAEFSSVVPLNQQRDILFADHNNQAQKYLREIESEIKVINSTISNVESPNSQGNKHFFMS